ncbi:MAG: hypothetical protein TEF_11985 [Rhizobiales bacterium NRL2]|nr:MAG: hypothetical protein TEF_11985 [Rhizobiales bacterium NRL2]
MSNAEPNGRLKDFLEIANEWFWETDQDHRFTFLSEKLRDITGVDPANYIGRHRVEMSADPDAPSVREHLADLAAHRPFHNYVYRGDTPKGNLWFRVSGRPVFGPDGGFLGYRGTGVDVTDQVETEKRADRAQSQLETALQTINEGFTFFDAEDRCVIANQRYREFFDPDDVCVRIGDTFEQILRRMVDRRQIGPAHSDHESWLQRRLAGHRTGSFNEEVQTGDGRWFSISEHALPGVGVIGVSTDITERKRREQELQTQRDLMRSVFASMKQGICVVDSALRIRTTNQRYRDLMDLPAVMLAPGRPFLDIVEHNLARDEYGDAAQSRRVQSFADLLARREAHRFERRRPNGTALEIQADPLRDGGMIISVMDITESYRFRESLKEREQRYRQLVESNPDSILVHRDGRILYANRECVRMFRAGTREALLRRGSKALMHPEDLPRIDSDVRAMLAEGVGSHRGSMNYRAMRFDGEVFELETETSIVPFDGYPAVQVIARDVTARREREMALRRAKEEAELASRAKSEFLANMSHELRTPLNAIIGFAEILSGRMFGPLGHEKYETYAADIHESGRHLLSVINDILDLSKAESGQFDIHESTFDLAFCLQACLRLVQERADRRGVTIVNCLADAPVVEIHADERLIKQILLNLLSNAVKFTERGGEVRIEAGVRGPRFVVSITDTGIGIPRNRIGRMFEAFTQGHTGLSRKFDGTGLGLPLSRSLAELHGGTVEIDSVEGQGTTAELHLPATRVMPAGDDA